MVLPSTVPETTESSADALLEQVDWDRWWPVGDDSASQLPGMAGFWSVSGRGNRHPRRLTSLHLLAHVSHPRLNTWILQGLPGDYCGDQSRWWCESRGGALQKLGQGCGSWDECLEFLLEETPTVSRLIHLGTVQVLCGCIDIYFIWKP